MTAEVGVVEARLRAAAEVAEWPATPELRAPVLARIEATTPDLRAPVLARIAGEDPRTVQSLSVPDRVVAPEQQAALAGA